MTCLKTLQTTELPSLPKVQCESLEQISEEKILPSRNIFYFILFLGGAAAEAEAVHFAFLEWARFFIILL